MDSKEIKCPVVLSFDIDGTSGLINMDPRTRNFPSLMSMREYGPNIAMPRILKILKKHDIKSSFYIPGFIADTHSELVKTIFDEGHEIGHHGYMHEPPATLTKQEEIDVIDKGIESIRRRNFLITILANDFNYVFCHIYLRFYIFRVNKGGI